MLFSLDEGAIQGDIHKFVYVQHFVVKSKMIISLIIDSDKIECQASPTIYCYNV